MKMIKRIILIIFLLLILICLVQFIKESILNNPEKIYNNIFPKYQSLANLSLKNIVYSPEREMVYLLRYMGIIPIGKAKMLVEEEDGHILLKAIAKTSGFMEKIYKAEAQIHSLIDKKKFYPFKYTEIINLPERKEEKEIIYHQDKHIMEREDKKYKIPPLTFCPISAVYYLQIQDLKLGKNYQINLVSKEDVYLFKTEVVEKKDNIFKLKGSVRRRNLSSPHGANFTIWLSEDLRIPLLFKVKTQAGILIGRAIGER